MPTPRRQLVRPVLTPVADPQRDRRLQKLRVQLDAERTTLTRWMTKLRRAFHAVERTQQRVSRIERTITRTEE